MNIKLSLFKTFNFGYNEIMNLFSVLLEDYYLLLSQWFKNYYFIMLIFSYNFFFLIFLIICEKLHKIIYIFFYTAPRYPSPNWTLISSLVQDQNTAPRCPNANWASNLESPAQPHIWYPYFVPPS